MDYKLLVILLKNLSILPFQEIKLELKDDISQKIIKLSKRKFNNRVLVASLINNNEDIKIDDLALVGVVAYIKNSIELTNGNLRVTLRGEKRIQILNFSSYNNEIIEAFVTDITNTKIGVNKEKVLLKKLNLIIDKYIKSSPNISNSIIKLVNETNDLNFLTDLIVTFIPFSVNRKMFYMQEDNPEKRATELLKDINKEIKYIELENEIDTNVESKLTKEQEDFYLKEKVNEINKKLGYTTFSDISSKYIEILDNLEMNSKSYNKIKNEIEKLQTISEVSPENIILRNYLDWILYLPWNNLSKENLNVKNVLSSLNKSHYGLNKVKEKIEDYIHLKKINPNADNPVICLVGPPGVGKTTISESIASSLNREFYKISLGGLNDSTEIVGNRRTYLGALPGKIIQGIKKCNTKNPVILLDEIDKMVKDYKGDPASTLLDVLDSNQNKAFVDNYIEEPFDLSNVLFIATANNCNNIPYTLADRLDIIELNSYTIYEKIDIAIKYIIPKIANELNLTKKLNIKEDTIEFIIANYTEEAGVRNLTRILKTLIIRSLTHKTTYTINTEDINKYLEKKDIDNKLMIVKESGIVNALAYTDIGGKVIQVECALYPGKEKIIITGFLGDVLKESIDVALSYIKEKNYVSSNEFYNRIIHIHLLDNATKKEGPSCGVSITVAILSKLLDVVIPSNVAFTGEITLKGRILKIGGLKEKIIAAYNKEIKIIYIPKDNENDLQLIPEKIIKSLEIKLVSNFDFIYDEIFRKNNLE